MKTSLVALTVLVLLVITAAVSSRDTAEASDAWPGPDGVTIADGMNPGEAVLTWSTVEKAAYYRIGWVAGSEYQARADGGADWQEGFAFTDAPNRGQASHLVTGLTPGGEYHFVVASHDGRIPTLQPPHEFASFRLADIPATSGNHPGQVRLEGPWRTDFPELWLNICRPDNSGRGRYCVTVPTGYVDFDETAEWIEGIREGAFFGLSGNLTDVEDRARFYRDMLLEMVIQPGTRGDVFRGEVLADFPETARATIELAEIVTESVEAFTELADSELFKAHLEHLHAHGFFLGAKLGTHLVDVAIAAAANRTIEIEEARKRLGLLEQDIRTAMPNDLAWEAAFGMVWQELEDMDNPDAMTRWSNALSDNLDEIALTISKFLVAHAAKTAAVAGAKAAATALGATVSIPAAPITLTVGLAVWVVYYVIEETDQFWDELILSSTALQVYLAMTSIKREEDEDNILGYATFAFYHHLHNAIDTSVWIFDFNEQQLKSNRVSVMERRDQLLVQMIDTPWMPDEDFNGISITYPEGITSDATTMWVADDVSNTIYAFSLATKTRHSAKDIGLPKLSLRGIWHAGAIMWLADSSGRGIFAYHVERDFLDDENTIVVRQASNAYPAGVWSEKDTLWVADREDAKIYAYNIGTKRRYPPKDLDGLRAAGNDDPYGIWSDGETMWVADREDDKVYAYTLATARRDVSREFELINVPGVVHNGGPTGIWSNGETMWVADDMDPYTDGKIYAYQLPPQPTSDPAAIPFQHNPSKELSRLNLAENHDAEGIWSDGQTMWIADQDDDRVYAYRVSDGARADPQNEEFHLAGSGSFGGQDHATGIWSDGATMWIADHDDDHIYAYRLSGGARVEDEEYDLNQPSVHSEYATGIWFDSTNGRMWVADRLAGKIYGFDANSKELVGTIDALDCAGNHDPQGIWSDGTTMWVADDDDGRIYAYSIGDNLRDPGKEFNTLKAANNNDARGIWSDGRTTMWVADQDKNWVYAYNMPELLLSTPAPAVLGNPSHLVVGPAGLHGVVTLNWRPAANANIHRIYLTNADGTESRYWDFDLCGDANAAMIGLRHRDQEYRFRVIAGLRGTDGNIQWSDSEWSYPILGDGFSHATIPSLGNPTSLAAAPGSQSGEVTLRWTAAANATVQWVYLVKPDGTDGRYWPHALAGDAATLTVTGLDAGETYFFLVIAGQEQADGTMLWSQWSNWGQADATGAVVMTTGEAFARNPVLDFDGLAAASNEEPWGLWSNGTTMWVSDVSRDKIYAYEMTSRERVPDKEFNTLGLAGNNDPRGIWSDGRTMWVVDRSDAKIYAYDLNTGERVPNKDFDTLIAAGNNTSEGIWSNGETMWVADQADRKIYAYNMTTKVRLPGEEFNALGQAGSNEVRGIWSDGVTMWVVSHFDLQIHAFDMVTKERVPGKGFDILASEQFKGIWSDGKTMWVVDGYVNVKIYAYHMPPDVAQALSPLGNPANLTATPGSQTGEVSLRWTPAANATVHRVYLQKADGTDGSDWPDALSGDAEGATITGLEVGQSYQFRVIAGQEQADGTTRWSQWSNWARGVPGGEAFARNPGADFNGLMAAGNNKPWGLWSDGTTMWVGDESDGKIYSYDLSTKSRVPAEEFNNLVSTGREGLTGIWSDGITMWTVDYRSQKIFAYDMDTKRRVPIEEFDTLIAAGNSRPNGIWSDGATLWVGNWGAVKIFAYDLKSKERIPSQDFDTLRAAGNEEPEGIWSDGTTMWVLDWADRKIYAYDMQSKERVPAMDYHLAGPAGHSDLKGIWSDGTTMWVAHAIDDKIYAYNMPAAATGTVSLANLDGLLAASGETLSNGSYHTCGLRIDGMAVCWGDNNHDQTSPPAGETFTAISSGYRHTCGLRIDGTAICWGDNSRGQASPPAGETFTAISSGTWHTCGLRADGKATCWGSNRSSQETFSTISSGAYHTCGLRRDGSVDCWGDNSHGQASPPAGETFAAISSGTFHTCGLGSDGSVACWGSNQHGQVMPPPGETFAAISSGSEYSCGLRTDGAVACWGRNDDGPGQTTPPAGETFTAISSGGLHACGLRANGSVACWGRNGRGQATPPAGEVFAVNLSISQEQDTSQVQMSISGGWHTCALRPNGVARCWGLNDFGQAKPPIGEKFSTIHTRHVHTCGLRADGSAVCWGYNRYGQSTPPAGETFTAIASSDWHTCGLRTNGSVICWGYDVDGRASVPTGESFTMISAGYAHTCGLRANGTVRCWGRHDYGQSTPPAGQTFPTIHSGYWHTCGLTDDGLPQCWGRNDYGQSTPPTGENLTVISGGGYHTCGLTMNGSAWCWGRNTDGQATPPAGETFAFISSGYRHTCGLRSNGTATCWGDNRYGQASPPEGEVFAVDPSQR